MFQPLIGTHVNSGATGCGLLSLKKRMRLPKCINVKIEELFYFITLHDLLHPAALCMHLSVCSVLWRCQNRDSGPSLDSGGSNGRIVWHICTGHGEYVTFANTAAERGQRGMKRSSQKHYLIKKDLQCGRFVLSRGTPLEMGLKLHY